MDCIVLGPLCYTKSLHWGMLKATATQNLPLHLLPGWYNTNSSEDIIEDLLVENIIHSLLYIGSSLEGPIKILIQDTLKIFASHKNKKKTKAK